MYNIWNEKLQVIVTKEFITNDGQALDGCFETVDDAYTLVATNTLDRLVYNAKVKANSGVSDVIRDMYRVNGEPVEGLYATDDSRYIVATNSYISKNLDMQAEIKRLNAVNSSLQAQIINNGTVLDKKYRVSAKKEAVEKFGDEIVSDYLKEHRDELIEQFRPEIEASCRVDEEAIIREYLETHKRKAHWENANKKRSENCFYRTALYLADFYSGSSTQEIAEKHSAVRGTIQRLLRVNDKSDVERLMQAYSSNMDVFGEITEKDVRDFLEARLAKKRASLEKKLAQAREFIAKNTPSEDDTPSDDDWSE